MAEQTLEMSNRYPEHRFVMSNLEKILDKFMNGLKCVVMREAKYDWAEAEGVKYEPDISILCGLRHRKKLCYTDVPRFAAEILSDTTEKTDRNEKMKIYALVGIQEYWLVDWRVPGGLVERYMLDDSGEYYLLHDKVQGINPDQEINILSFPTWTFKMSELMKHIGEDEIMDEIE